MNEAGHQTEDRPARHRQTELMADVIRVGLLAFPVACGERLRQLGADPWIPAFLDAVQYARQLRGVRATTKQAFDSAAEVRRRYLPGVRYAASGQIGSVDEA